jgi:peptide/nickel transport system permease protein
MPAQSRNPGDELVETLAADERADDVAPDQATLILAGIEAGPEIDHARKRKGLGIGAWLAIAWLVIIVGAAVLAPVLPLPDPVNDAVTSQIRQGPSADHVFGSDASGRDVLSRVVWGARNSLFIATVSVVAGLVVGGTLGIIGGYFKGRIGGFIGAVLDILLAFPQLILALSIVTFLGNSVANVTFALAIVSTPVLARIGRASTLTWSEREFVTAARAQGAKHGRVMVRELLPNVMPAMLSISLLGVAVVIVAEAGLAIIGAGVKPDVVTWGNVIVTGTSELRDAPHIVLAPSIAIYLPVLSLNFLGDVVRARFDVRESAL